MTDEELRDYAGKPVRVTLADGRILAGKLHADDDSGHGHMHYTVVSDAVREGGGKVHEVLHGVDVIVQVEDASQDPAAVE